MKCWGVIQKNFFPHEEKINTSRGKNRNGGFVGVKASFSGS